MVQHTPFIRHLPVERDNLTALFRYSHRLSAHRIDTVPRLTEPTVNLIILTFEVGDKPTVGLQVNRQFLVGHRLYDCVLHKVSVQLCIEEHILDASRNVLIMRAPHQCIARILAVMRVAEYNILEHHTRLHSRRDRDVLVYAFSYLHPVAQHFVFVGNKPFAPVWSIDETP